MELQNNFQERAEDIESFFSLLTFIDSIESYGINSNIYTNNSHIKVTAQLQQCLRSHAILLLYNLLESTINNCIWRIYDKIHDEKLTYNDLSTSLKKIWLSKEYKEDTKLSKTIDKTYKIIEEHNEKKILFTQIADSISGNIDLRKIESLFKQYQCNIDFA